MGVQLNIKDAETVELARDLAKQLGKSVTEAIKHALKEAARTQEATRLERVAAINALIDQIRNEMPADVRNMGSKELMDSIYDDNEPDGFAR